MLIRHKFLNQKIRKKKLTNILNFTNIKIIQNLERGIEYIEDYIAPVVGEDGAMEPMPMVEDGDHEAVMFELEYLQEWSPHDGDPTHPIQGTLATYHFE